MKTNFIKLLFSSLLLILLFLSLGTSNKVLAGSCGSNNGGEYCTTSASQTCKYGTSDSNTCSMPYQCCKPAPYCSDQQESSCKRQNKDCKPTSTGGTCVAKPKPYCSSSEAAYCANAGKDCKPTTSGGTCVAKPKPYCSSSEAAYCANAGKDCKPTTSGGTCVAKPKPYCSSSEAAYCANAGKDCKPTTSGGTCVAKPKPYCSGTEAGYCANLGKDCKPTSTGGTCVDKTLPACSGSCQASSSYCSNGVETGTNCSQITNGGHPVCCKAAPYCSEQQYISCKNQKKDCKPTSDGGTCVTAPYCSDQQESSCKRQNKDCKPTSTGGTCVDKTLPACSGSCQASSSYCSNGVETGTNCSQITNGGHPVCCKAAGAPYCSGTEAGYCANLGKDCKPTSTGGTCVDKTLPACSGSCQASSSYCSNGVETGTNCSQITNGGHPVCCKAAGAPYCSGTEAGYCANLGKDCKPTSTGGTCVDKTLPACSGSCQASSSYCSNGVETGTNCSQITNGGHPVCCKAPATVTCKDSAVCKSKNANKPICINPGKTNSACIACTTNAQCSARNTSKPICKNAGKTTSECVASTPTCKSPNQNPFYTCSPTSKTCVKVPACGTNNGGCTKAGGSCGGGGGGTSCKVGTGSSLTSCGGLDKYVCTSATNCEKKTFRCSTDKKACISANNMGVDKKYCAKGSICNPTIACTGGQVSPHFVCENNACKAVNACGVNDSSCTKTNASCGATTGDIILTFSLGFDGLGNIGNRASRLKQNNNEGNSNPDPVAKTKTITIDVYDNSTKKLATSKTGDLAFDANKMYSGNVNLGKLTNNSTYYFTIKSEGYIDQLLPGSYTVGKDLKPVTATNKAPNVIPSANMATGDINQDQFLSILDYNIIAACTQDEKDSNLRNETLCNSNPKYKTLSDIWSSGTVENIDLLLFGDEWGASK